jgi:hypothetical protein
MAAASSADAGATWSSALASTSSSGFSIAAAENGDPSLAFEVVNDIKVMSGVLAMTPGTPASVTAVPTQTDATVSWSAADDGGSPITGYTATTSPGGRSCSGTASCVITGLTPDTEYGITVTARNAVGEGPASTPITVRTQASPPPPAPRAQTVKRPPAKLKKGKRARLAATSNAGQRVAWRSTTKKRCAVTKGRLVAKKKGVCRLSAKAPAVAGFEALSQRFVVRIR